jgi:ATP-binding protein involved in chromosome partitioning
VSVTAEAVQAALATVIDPEIRRPITEIDMVKSVAIDGGTVTVGIFLTISSCPMQDTIVNGVKTAVSKVRDVTAVEVELDVMSQEQREKLKEKLQGPAKEIRFNRAGSTTKIYAIASGKGGVGKSSITVNLAVAMAAQGLNVGVVDADIYGHSIPDMLGATALPTVVENMMMPPRGHGVAVMSILAHKKDRLDPVPVRGPMLHRYLESFLTDAFWGELDVLLLDLPPGTGDVAMSTASLLPQSELIIVTTPQPAAADVAIRSGTFALAPTVNQRIAGVIENMSAFACPHCGEPIDMFGAGGGHMVAETLSKMSGTNVALLGKVPFDPKLREGGDNGSPLVLSDPDSPAAKVIYSLAEQLGKKSRGLVGLNLAVEPVRN